MERRALHAPEKRQKSSILMCFLGFVVSHPFAKNKANGWCTVLKQTARDLVPEAISESVLLDFEDEALQVFGLRQVEHNRVVDCCAAAFQ